MEHEQPRGRPLRVGRIEVTPPPTDVGAHLATRRQGNVLHVARGRNAISIKCRARPIAEQLEAKVLALVVLRPDLPFDRLIETATDEIEWSFYAQAKRRFGSSFGAGRP